MKPKFKIGIDARMYGNEQTGIGNYIKHLIKYLAEFDQENEYRIFLLEPEFSKFVLPGKNFEKIKVTAHWYSWAEQIILPFQLNVESSLRQSLSKTTFNNFYKFRNLDLIHFPHFNAPIFYSGKRVMTIHDLTPKFFPGHKMNSFLRRAGFWLVFYFGIKKTEKIIVPSQATKNDIIKYFKTKSEKIKVIYEGVDQPAAINQQPATSKYILYIGVWRNHKNLVGLIKAFDILLKKYKVDCKLVLGGKENPYYPEIRKTLLNLNLQKNIICPGFIPEKDLRIFYQNAELVVIPSFYEGFGLVGLEAMSLGKPVVCSDIPALREVFGPAALFFNPYNPSDTAEKIFKVLKDEKLKQDLINKGFEQIKKYSWKKMVQNTLEIYKEVLRK